MASEIISFDEMCQQAEEFSNQPFEPNAVYHAGSDSLFVQLKPGPQLRERIDGRLTIYKDLETEEIIGAQIKGYRAMCETIAKKSGFKVWQSYNNKINVGYLLFFQVIEGNVTGISAVHYMNLSRQASCVEAEPALCGA